MSFSESQRYGPGGVAIFVEGVSDNKNRTTSEVRTIFTKKGGNMAGAGSVSWMFEKKGYFVISKETIDEDKLMGLALDAGASDFNAQEDVYEITTEVADFEKVKKALSDAGIATQSAELTRIPSATVKIADLAAAKNILALIENLEDHDDVQNVYANMDIPDEILRELAK